MESFEELGLEPELAEALAADGVEVPTPLQTQVIPVVRRGGNLIVRAGAGAGTLLAYGLPLLSRLDPGGGSPVALILLPTREAAQGAAESLARIAMAAGHGVAALGGGWALPERADLLFASPVDLLEAIRKSRVKLEGVQAVVVDGLGGIEALAELESLETLLETVPPGAQRVVLSLPLQGEAEAFAARVVRKAVHLPPRPASGDSGSPPPPSRGKVRFRLAPDSRNGELLRVVASLLEEEGHRHVVVFCRGDDAAADLGDTLTLHGYVAGPPGDPSVPVWLAVDELEGHEAVTGSGDPAALATLSVDVPSGPDSLDRRHRSGAAGVVLALPRELPHLREVAALAGYALEPWPPPAPSRVRQQVGDLRARLAAAADGEGLGGAFLLLEPLLADHDPLELAAAAVSLLMGEGPRELGSAATPSGPDPQRPTPFIRLFLSVGARDGIGPGDLVGAVTGEAGVDGSSVGRIEIRDTFSRMEVVEDVAARVVRALNGITIKGRSVRADYDRGGSSGAAPPAGRGGRGGGSGGGSGGRPRGDEGRRGRG